jgi:hypothetical protein
MSSLGPLIVWDIREGDPQGDRWRARAAWLAGHGFPRMTYRVEFYQEDPPYARAFCYALDADGKRHWNEHHPVPPVPHDHSRCAPAREEPRDIPLDYLPGASW